MAHRKNKWYRKRQRWADARAKRSHERSTRVLQRSGWSTVSYVVWCPHHEKKALTRLAAQKLTHLLRQPGMREYPCDAYPGLDLWHVGHLPDSVRKGYVAAEQVYGKENHDQ